MICPNKTEWVLYASGEVSPDRRRALEAHLAGCDVCRAEAEGMARGLAALATLERDPVVRPQVTESLRTRAREAAARPTVVSLWRRYRWVAAAAAVVVLAIGLAIVVPMQQSQGLRPGTPAAATPWVTDTHLQEEIAEITAGVEMLEAASNGKAPDVAPADSDDQSYEELEFFFDQLRAEVDA